MKKNTYSKPAFTVVALDNSLPICVSLCQGNGKPGSDGNGNFNGDAASLRGSDWSSYEN